jgi:hypothetical protein
VVVRLLRVSSVLLSSRRLLAQKAPQKGRIRCTDWLAGLRTSGRPYSPQPRRCQLICDLGCHYGGTTGGEFDSRGVEVGGVVVVVVVVVEWAAVERGDGRVESAGVSERLCCWCPARRGEGSEVVVVAEEARRMSCGARFV